MGQRFQTQDQLQLCKSWQSHAHVALHPFTWEIRFPEFVVLHRLKIMNLQILAIHPETRFSLELNQSLLVNYTHRCVPVGTLLFLQLTCTMLQMTLCHLILCQTIEGGVHY
jgi:hypothetical protein